jgi:hypothetical protein
MLPMAFPELNQSEYALLESLRGGFFFHPTSKDHSLGTRERKKPLEDIRSGYSNSGFAPVSKGFAPLFPVYQCAPTEGYFRQLPAVGETPSTERLFHFKEFGELRAPSTHPAGTSRSETQ